MRFSRIGNTLKALMELGPTQVGLNALYRFGLLSGHYRRVTAQPPAQIEGLRLEAILPLPAAGVIRQSLGEEGLRSLEQEAEEIRQGKFRMFGAEAVPIQLAPEGPLLHWTECERQPHPTDIKFTWEPARFGWVFALGRAYLLWRNESHAACFWEQFETFTRANPAYLGANWTSGQEVGLRLMAWIWAAQVFASSTHSTPERQSALAQAVAEHAARIPCSLPYARSQNNNHLLSEAAALFSAGLALPGHPEAKKWRATGEHWLAWCFLEQVDRDGEYVQHSSNYQRLALHLALWVDACARCRSLPFPGAEPARENLARATRWLVARLDPLSGEVPNLGANDGALIFPLAGSAFGDYRPTAQAAARAFLGGALTHVGQDKLSPWLGLPSQQDEVEPGPGRERIQAKNSWASLRAVHYHSRPSHADQLHCELWWQGLNIARDAGTYLYNAELPWDNPLTSTLVHNTVSVNGAEQMTRASRFLYVDWADATFVEHPEGVARNPVRITAETDAYRRFQVRHRRSLSLLENERWQVQDELLRTSAGPNTPATYRLHWLLPDWEWEVEQENQELALRLRSPHGPLSLGIRTSQAIARAGLSRAGQMIYGGGLVSAVYGWHAPTYDVKNPALSLAVEVQSSGDVFFTSEFGFPG